jgi:Chaperone of endosialidase
MSNVINADNGSISGVAGLKYSADTSGALVLQTNGTNALAISTSQKIGIGTASPVSNLDIYSTAAPASLGVNAPSTYSAILSLLGNGNTLGTSDFTVFQSGSNSDATLLNRANANLTFGTNNIERMRIDSSGNVGIGTTTTTSGKLNVKASTGGTAIYATDSVNADFFIDFPSSQISRITSQYGTGGVLAFAIGSSKTEAMRIDSSGNLIVRSTNGTINSYTGVQVWGTGASTDCIAVKNTNTSTLSALSCWNSSGSYIGGISNTNTTTALIATSDYRLKDNITPIVNATETIKKLNPVTYTWKLDNSEGQGFIAHELQNVFPAAVFGEKDAVNQDGSIKPQGIDQTQIIATLTAAIQEQQVMIEELKAEVAALKAK